ncbi:MAG: glycine oxidase ThiO [Thiobacillus sp. SCN 64-35]|nr:MAG: glycine oxidase ThiO [Thiobacillus sp. SCN 64-35]
MNGISGYLLAKLTLIIGAGITGLSLAWEMMQRGRQVMILERGRAGSESTWAGGGILFPLLPWDYPDAVTDLAMQSMRDWPRWITGIRNVSGQDAEYRVCGLRIHRIARPEAVLDWCIRHGFDAKLESSGSALWLPGIAQVRNPRIAAALRAACIRAGARLHESQTDFTLHPQGNHVQTLQLDGQAYTVDQVAIATGAWAGLPLAGMAPVPHIRPIRGQMLLFRLAPGALDTMVYCEGTYLIPRLDGHILVGSTLEDAGFDKSTDAETARRLHQQATEWLPALAQHQPIQHWSGLRPGSPGNIPVIGRHPDYNNVFVNVGHYRYGLTMAPAAADLLADLMEGKTPALDPAPYRWAAAQQRHWSDRL